MAEEVKQPVQMRNIGGVSVNHLYCDGMCQVQVIGDMVKIDTWTLVPVSERDAAPTITGRIIMPLATFLQTEELFKQCIGQLVANGTIEQS